MAYSAAAMIAIACDEIVMGADAHIGDAQPITLDPGGGFTPGGEKIESPLRAKARRYAEANGHPSLLAEAMISERLEVLQIEAPDGTRHFVLGDVYRSSDDGTEVLPGVDKSETRIVRTVSGEGDLLTLTAQEALAYGLIDRRFDSGEGAAAFPEDEEALLVALRAEGGTVHRFGMTFGERASRFLLGLAGVLGALVAISVIVLLWQGPSLMTIVGGVALLLILLIHGTADMLHGFPLFLVGVGILLLATEMFLIPGFGIAGIAGIAAMATGFLLLAAGASIGDTSGVTSELVIDFGLKFIVTTLVCLFLLMIIPRALPTLGPTRGLVLGPPERPGRAPGGAAPAPGARGIAYSALRPGGTAEIDGRLVDVEADGEFIARGEAVEVVRVEGSRVTVLPARDGGAARPLAGSA
jgi:membrane-bound serine protease (ClpP class)